MKDKYNNLIERLYENIKDCIKQYKNTTEHTQFQKGVAEGIYETADTIRNQMIIDEIKVDEKLNKAIDELENIIK